MARKRMTFDIVREIGLTLPHVEDSTAYGSPALKVRGKLLACMAVNKSAEPGSLAVRIDFEQRSGLLTEAPETYYLTDHYRNYPAVLVRLSRIPMDELRDLLSASWHYVTSQAKKSRRSSRRAGGAPVKTAARKSRNPTKR
jgi:hypothetical protein